MDERDLQAFRLLWEHGLQHTPDAFLLTEDEARSLSDTQVLSGLSAGHHWGANVDGRLVGIASMRPGTLSRLRHTADIGPLYVHPEFQRQGVARALMIGLLAHASNTGLLQVELCVDARNDAALSLYHSLGFQIFGTRRRSVIIDGFPRDDHLMMHVLPTARA
ncbi:MAG: GNAT family N-acetyltransferase [Pseudomonadota bacterium]